MGLHMCIQFMFKVHCSPFNNTMRGLLSASLSTAIPLTPHIDNLMGYTWDGFSTYIQSMNRQCDVDKGIRNTFKRQKLAKHWTLDGMELSCSGMELSRCHYNDRIRAFCYKCYSDSNNDRQRVDRGIHKVFIRRRYKTATMGMW